MEREVADQTMHPTIILKVAKENANKACKRVISRMPVYPEPSLPALVEARMKKATAIDARLPSRRAAPPAALATHQPAPPTDVPETSAAETAAKGGNSRNHMF